MGAGVTVGIGEGTGIGGRTTGGVIGGTTGGTSGSLVGKGVKGGWVAGLGVVNGPAVGASNGIAATIVAGTSVMSGVADNWEPTGEGGLSGPVWG